MDSTNHENVKVTYKKHPKFKIICASDGNIFSLKTLKPRSLWKTRLGYTQLAIGRTSYLSHRLIADVFLDNPLDKKEVNHKNGIKHDNRVENLEWVTRRENIIHARDKLNVKFSQPGELNPNFRVTKPVLNILINLYKRGFTYKEISEISGLCSHTISRHLKAAIND